MWKALAVVYGSLLLATTSQWDIVKSLCEDMRPPGDDKPRTDPSPYTIKVDWTINSAVVITVYGFYCLGHTFRGVMIQVRANSTPIGTFSRFSRKLIFLNCPPGIRNMAYNVSRTKQLFIATIWRPPAEFLIMDNVRIQSQFSACPTNIVNESEVSLDKTLSLRTIATGNQLEVAKDSLRAFAELNVNQKNVPARKIMYFIILSVIMHYHAVINKIKL